MYININLTNKAFNFHPNQLPFSTWNIKTKKFCNSILLLGCFFLIILGVENDKNFSDNEYVSLAYHINHDQ